MAYIYDGRGKSRRALEAEQMGHFTMTKAAPIVRRILKRRGIKISLDEAKSLCRRFWKGEWHHTGLYGRRTEYYDVGYIVEEATKEWR